MIRIYIKGFFKELESCCARYDGGHWFCEEYESGERKSYKVIQRIALSDSKSIFEVLEPLDDNFIQLPCWQNVIQEPFLQKQNPYSGWSLIQLSYPLSFPLKTLPQEAEYLRNEIEDLIKKYKIYELQASSNQVFPLQHHKQDPKQRAKSPLQNKQPHQLSSENQPSYPREEKQLQDSIPSQLNVLPIPFSAAPKGVQFGSLCLPVNLPDEQSPRKSTRHLKEPKKSLLQGRQQFSSLCLIDPNAS